jgi:hypothetical protein
MLVLDLFNDDLSTTFLNPPLLITERRVQMVTTHLCSVGLGFESLSGDQQS